MKESRKRLGIQRESIPSPLDQEARALPLGFLRSAKAKGKILEVRSAEVPFFTK